MILVLVVLLPGSDDARLLVGLVAEAIADDVAEKRDGVVGDGVVGRCTRLAAADDARIVEDAEVFGDVGLAGAEGLDDIADVHLTALEEEAEDAEARRIAEDAEAFSDVREEVFGDRFGHVSNYMSRES